MALQECQRLSGRFHDMVPLKVASMVIKSLLYKGIFNEYIRCLDSSETNLSMPSPPLKAKSSPQGCSESSGDKGNNATHKINLTMQSRIATYGCQKGKVRTTTRSTCRMKSQAMHKCNEHKQIEIGSCRCTTGESKNLKLNAYGTLLHHDATQCEMLQVHRTQATPPWQHYPQHHLTHSSSLSTGGCSGARRVALSR